MINFIGSANDTLQLGNVRLDRGCVSAGCLEGSVSDKWSVAQCIIKSNEDEVKHIIVSYSKEQRGGWSLYSVLSYSILTSLSWLCALITHGLYSCHQPITRWQRGHRPRRYPDGTSFNDGNVFYQWFFIINKGQLRVGARETWPRLYAITNKIFNDANG